MVEIPAVQTARNEENDLSNDFNASSMNSSSAQQSPELREIKSTSSIREDFLSGKNHTFIYFCIIFIIVRVCM